MKKTFTLAEVQFLYGLLKNKIESPEGCHIAGTDVKCPYWQINEVDSEQPGECLMKKQNRVCTKLELPLVDDTLLLEVREKQVEDYLRDLDSELKNQKAALMQVSGEMKHLNTQRQVLQEEISKLEQKRNRIAQGEESGRDPNDDQ